MTSFVDPTDNKNPQYKPEQGNQFITDSVGYARRDGYSNMPYLKDMLDAIIKGTQENILLAETYLTDYALKVEPNSRLAKAQAKEWPESLGPPKDVITYKQYKAMRKLNTRSSDYIAKLYEKYARGPSGNHNVDLVLANEVLNIEARNICTFIEQSLKDLVHSSERRTVEILQDWAEDALTFTGQLGSLTKKGAQGVHTDAIPQTELDQIDKQDAVQFQTLFKTKVNSFNEQIAQLTEDLHKDVEAHAKVFYGRFLGPTLRFELELGSQLKKNSSAPETFLGMHAQAGEASFGWQIEQLLTDGLKRNENFRANMQGLIFAIDKRDDYNGFIQQLESKGSQIKQFFTKDDLTTDEEKEFQALVDEITEVAPPIDEEFVSDHNVLDNLLDPEAHPQYLLKDGDMVTGDIAVKDGVKIDGVDINKHDHDGINTPKIKGKNIEGGTLGTDVINTGQRPDPPRQLRVKRVVQDTIPPGVNVFDLTIAWVGKENHTFEVQVAPYNEMLQVSPYDD